MTLLSVLSRLRTKNPKGLGATLTLKLQIEKLNRDRYGPCSERTARLLDQLELTLEELETAATRAHYEGLTQTWPKPSGSPWSKR